MEELRSNTYDSFSDYSANKADIYNKLVSEDFWRAIYHAKDDAYKTTATPEKRKHDESCK